MTAGAPDMPEVYTIGHSTRTIDEFIEILRAFKVATVVDVRTVPGSRHNPQFSHDALDASLRTRGFAYTHFPDLGGLRKPLSRDISKNNGWRNDSFRGFADYMQTPAFASALSELISLSSGTTPVLMCAEALPWRCHRSLIADALFIRNIPVVHLISRTSSRPHELTRFAVVRGLEITYPEGGPSTKKPNCCDPE